MPDEQYDVAVNIEANDQASGALGGVAGTAQEVGGAIADASKSVATGGAAMAAGLAPAVKEFAGVEETMAEVEAQSGATKKEMKAMRESLSADQLENLGKSAGDTANVYKRLAAEGFSVNQMRRMMNPIMQTSVALHQDEARTTKAMLNLMRQYRIDAKNMTQVSDALAGALANTSFQGQEVTDALSYLGPTASSANMSLQETIAMAAAVDDQIGNASRSGRMLRGVLGKIQAPTKAFKDELKKSSVTLSGLQGALDNPVRLTKLLTKLQKDNANVAQMFGRETKGAVLALRNKSAAIAEDTKALKANGQAHSMANRMMNTTMGQFQRLQAQATNLAREIGQALRPVLESLVPIVKDIADKVEYVMDTGWGKWLVQAGGYASVAAIALGGVGYVLGQIISVGGTAVGVIRGVSAVVGTAGLAGSAASLGAVLTTGGTIAAVLALAYAGWKVYNAYTQATDAMDDLRESNENYEKVQERARKRGLLDPERLAKRKEAIERARPTVGETLMGWVTGGGVTGKTLAKERKKATLPTALPGGEEIDVPPTTREALAGLLLPGTTGKQMAEQRALSDAGIKAKEANEDLAGASKEASDELAGHSLTTASAKASTQLGKLGVAANKTAQQLRNMTADGGGGRAAGARQQTVNHEVRVRGDGAQGDNALLKQLAQSMMQDPEMRKRIEKMMGDALRTGYTSRQPA